ncbi:MULTISPECIES: hypothetical protein [Halomonas]|nr:hypothetical protein [Halomonas citrativorans]
MIEILLKAIMKYQASATASKSQAGRKRAGRRVAKNRHKKIGKQMLAD